jgi:uncharacterized protein YprB with RNaseH-like and TPR domain
MNIKLFLDIETLPDGDPIDPLSLTPPGNMKKPETIAEWYKTEAVSIAVEKYRQRALNSMEGRIFCIGMATDSHVTAFTGDEREMLAMFQAAVQTLLGRYSEPIQFIGWNIREFDIPFIWRKAIKYQLTALKKAFNRDRYRGNILDLMTEWGSNNRDMVKMSSVASFLGIESDDKVKGGDVYDLYLKNDLEAIVGHCKADVELLRKIYNRIYE